MSWDSECGPRALGTAIPLLTARVWVLCGGDGAVSTGTGLLSAGVRRGVAGSLSNWVGVQSARVWVSCGGLRALGTAVALQTARVGVLCAGHGALSTISGLLSAGVAVR